MRYAPTLVARNLARIFPEIPPESSSTQRACVRPLVLEEDRAFRRETRSSSSAPAQPTECLLQSVRATRSEFFRGMQTPYPGNPGRRADVRNTAGLPESLR